MAHASTNVRPFRQTFLNKFPAAVNVLGATFHLHGLSPRQLVDFHLNKIWLGPFPFPMLFDTLFLVDNRIMKNARELHLVRLGRVSVENHRAVGQPFLAQRPPILFCDGAGAWRPGSCQCWAESGKH